jgi:hypothetical protein
MRPSLKAFRSRASDRARRAAEGAGPPAGAELAHPAAAARPPGAIERGTLRRRLRRARRMRETLMTELGALVMEMHRQQRHDPALVERKAREALTADREASGLARALGAEQTVHQVVAAGIAGSCPACGALMATDDRFCARCGAAAAAVRNGAASAAAPAVAAPPPDPAARIAAPPPKPTARVAAAPPPDATARVVAPPPEAAARVAAAPPSSAPPARPAPPPDAATRVPPDAPRTGPAPQTAAPPPDPTTRVLGGDDSVQMTTGTPRR